MGMKNKSNDMWVLNLTKQQQSNNSILQPQQQMPYKKYKQQLLHIRSEIKAQKPSYRGGYDNPSTVEHYVIIDGNPNSSMMLKDIKKQPQGKSGLKEDSKASFDQSLTFLSKGQQYKKGNKGIKIHQ